MKKKLFIPFFLVFGIIFSQDFEGSWKLTHKNGEPVTDKEVVRIHQDGYFAYGAKEVGTNKFLSASGGEFTIKNNTYSEVKDFHTADPESLGKLKEFDLQWEGENSFTISDGTTTKKWERISAESNDLTRNWVITGRDRNGEMSSITPGDRRTVKILGGGRFQWIAFNSATGEFSGTGGGTYTAKDGKYTENIEFFSRDDSRVGASLEFEYEVKNGKWHHKGTSSKGDPIYEIWSPYSEAYRKP